MYRVPATGLETHHRCSDDIVRGTPGHWGHCPLALPHPRAAVVGRACTGEQRHDRTRGDNPQGNRRHNQAAVASDTPSTPFEVGAERD